MASFPSSFRFCPFCGGSLGRPRGIPEAAAIREVREETGLEIGTQRLVETRIENYRRPQGVDRLLSLYYIGHIIGGREQPGDEVTALAWFEWKALPKRLAGPTWRSFGHRADESLDR